MPKGPRGEKRPADAIGLAVLVGKIAKVSADSEYIVLSLNDQTQVTIKRDFVSAVLPKGSIQSL